MPSSPGFASSSSTSCASATGSAKAADTSITVGVVLSMDRNRWFECDWANRTIYGPVPDGLKICTDERHAFCKKRP